MIHVFATAVEQCGISGYLVRSVGLAEETVTTSIGWMDGRTTHTLHFILGHSLLKLALCSCIKSIMYCTP